MQTWFFALDAGPLTPWQIEQLDTGPHRPVILTPYADGTIMAAVDADTIREALALARTRVDDQIGKRPRITALHGELSDGVADTVLRAAEKLGSEADGPLQRHLASLWHAEALDMAALGAREEECFTGVLEGRPRRVPSTVVRPIERKDSDGPDYTIVELWAKIWHAAKAYLAGEEDECLAWMDERRVRRAEAAGETP